MGSFPRWVQSVDWKMLDDFSNDQRKYDVQIHFSIVALSQAEYMLWDEDQQA